MNFIIIVVYKHPFQVLQKIEMSLKKFPLPNVKSYEVEQMGPSVAFECPACSSEVSLNEIVEEKGNIRCVKCI